MNRVIDHITQKIFQYANIINIINIINSYKIRYNIIMSYTL